MRTGIVSIAVAAAVTGSLFLAANFGPSCQRPAAADDRDAPAKMWVVATAPEREWVKIALIQLAGFEIGKVIIVDDPAPVSPDAEKLCGL